MKLIALKEPVVIRKSNKGIKRARQPGYVTCLFDIKELPFYSYLPMVTPPIDWHRRPSALEGADKSGDSYLSEFTGGYLTSQETNGGSSPPLSVLANKGGGSFDILVDPNRSKKLFSAVNKLQRQPYKINTNFLVYLVKNWKSLVNRGLLLPGILASINRKEGIKRLRDHFLKNEEIKAYFDYKDLSNILVKNIQASNFELNIIGIAGALAGYNFYIPVFLDFRGRNYRYGPFHYHERDLVRSLILFADTDDSPAHTINTDTGQRDLDDNIVRNFGVSTVFHLRKWNSYEDSLECCASHANLMNDPSFLSVAIFEHINYARHPFQYLSACVTWFDYVNNMNSDDMLCTPLSQDASASAYQMLSYFLLDIDMGIHTNLITDSSMENPQILDIYDFMLGNLISHIEEDEVLQMAEKVCSGDESEDRSVSRLVRELFDRNIVKQLFMPKVYGKQDYTVQKDLNAKLSKYMPYEDIVSIFNHCSKFWKDNFAKLIQLMDLINMVSWMGAAHDHPVKYSSNYWTSIQDYMLCDSAKAKIQYETNETPKKVIKRSSVTLNITTDIRDTRKTGTSSFANFIHQKDAFAAVSFVDYLLQYQVNKGSIPIYIVHDNYLTTPEYAAICPAIYRRALVSMGHPLFIINNFIYDNIIVHAVASGMERFTNEEKNIARQMTYIYNSNVLPGLKPKSNPDDILSDIHHIPEGFLTTCLEILRTTKKKKNITKKRWDARAIKIVDAYTAYANDMKSDDGIERWERFKTNLYKNTDQFQDTLSSGNTFTKPDYSLHY